MGGLIAIGAGLCMGLAAMGVGIGQGIVSRQPEMSNKMVAYMIVAMAIMETALVLGFVVALILLAKI